MYSSKYDGYADKIKLAAEKKDRYEKAEAARREREAERYANRTSLEVDDPVASDDDDGEWAAEDEDHAAAESDQKAKFSQGKGPPPHGHFVPLSDRVLAGAAANYKCGPLRWRSSLGPNVKVFLFAYDAVWELNPLHQTHEDVLLFAKEVRVDANCAVWLGWHGESLKVATFPDLDQANAAADALRKSMAMRTAWYALHKASREGGSVAGIVSAFIEAEGLALFYLHPLTVAKRGTLFFDAGSHENKKLVRDVVAARDETMRARKFEDLRRMMPKVAAPEEIARLRTAVMAWGEYLDKQLRQKAAADKAAGLPVEDGERMKKVRLEAGDVPPV